jgi:trigger factor
MQVEIETTGPTERKLSVTIPATQVDEAFTTAYREVGKQARIPGFRPGKAPRGLLEVHYGAQVRSDVENKLITQTLYLALQQKDVAPIGMPRIEPGDLKKGNDFSYTAEVEVQPEIELGQYKHLIAPTVEVEVEEAEIEAELEKMREQATQLVPILIRDVVEEGDIVVMDYEGTIGGVPFDGGKGEDALIEIGGSDYLPGFSEGLVGAKVPSERDLPIDFPEDYTAKNLAGKKASFHVKVKEIKRRELPDLDDELAKDLGEESLEALRGKLVDAMRSKKEQGAKEQRRKTLLEALVAANPFDLPRSMVTAQAERMVAGATERIAAMTGQRFDLSDGELASLAKESETDAEFQVRSGLLLLEVAKKEGLQVDAASIDAEIEAMASQAGPDAARLKAHYASGEHRQGLEYRLLEDRTIAFLLEHAAEDEDAASAALKEEAAKAATADEDVEAEAGPSDVVAEAGPSEEKAAAEKSEKSGPPAETAKKETATKKKTAAKKKAAKKKTPAKKQADAKKKTASSRKAAAKKAGK